MRTDDLDFDLPPERVATEPARPRDAARLMVVRLAADTVEDRTVADLPDLLAAGDVLITNDTTVHAARLIGHKIEGGGRVEGLFLAAEADGTWRALLKGGRLRAGVRVRFTGEASDDAGLEVELLERAGAGWRLGVRSMEAAIETRSVHDVLDRVGRTPLPPYILSARRSASLEVTDTQDRDDYQAVYADPARAGSVAAPTAGLHFTSGGLERLAEAGVERESVTLHVGEGTFRPVTAESLDEHEMHAEVYEVGGPVLARLRNRAADRAAGRATPRVVAVGTTTVRTLESLPDPLPPDGAGPIADSTDLLIAPGHRFRNLDALMTNFHLPRSTLIALVAALAGHERTMRLYRRAVEEGYRFYSYGDAMLILP